MEVLVWVIAAPVLLLSGVLLKAFVLAFQPAIRAPIMQVSGSARRYSREAQEVMADRQLGQACIEEAISKGRRRERSRGTSYRYRDTRGLELLIHTDRAGNVEKIIV